MTLEQQVCSLPLAQRLKELGVKQESNFWWKHLTAGPNGPMDKWVVVSYSFPAPTNGISPTYHTSAFTVAELGEMLPWILGGFDLGNEKNATIEFQKVADKFAVIYTEDNETLAYHKGASLEQWDVTEADARAKMLIYLLENKLVTA